MKKAALVSQDAANAAFARALRLRVGRGKLYGFAALAEATELPERNLRAYADEENAPPLHAVLSVFSALGPGFASDVLAAAGMEAQLVEPAAPEHQKLLTAMMRLASDLSEALEDGRVDHREEAALRGPAQQLLEMLGAMAAKRGKRSGK